MSARRVFGIVLGGAAAATLLVAGGFIARHAAEPTRTLPGIDVIRPPHEVSALAFWRGRLWAGGRDGLQTLDLETGALQPPAPCDPPLRFVTSLAVREGDGLWIGHPGGLTLFDGENCRTFTENDGLPDRRVNCLLVDSSGALWAGTWKGAVRFRGGPRRVIDSHSGLASDMVRVMMEDSGGDLWFGSYVAPEGGLSVPDGDGWRPVTTGDGLPHPNVTSIFEGRDAVVRVGTGMMDRGGLALFEHTPAGWKLKRTLSREDGLAGEKVRAIHQDADGVYWIASEYDGVLVMKGDRQRVLTKREGLSANEVKVFLEDSQGGLRLGTRDGITVIEPGFGQRFLSQGEASP